MSSDFPNIIRTHAQSMWDEGFYTVSNALDRAASLIEDADKWRARESETQEALQAIGEEFGVRGGEPRVDGIRRVLTEQRDQIAALLREAGEGWRLIESAAKSEALIELGIERNGTLEEIHLGRWMPDVNEQGEDTSCWWSDQSDDEIRPTHWRPTRPLPAPPAAGGKDGED